MTRTADYVHMPIMPRKRKPRCCFAVPGLRVLKPAGIPMEDCARIHLRLDELEAVRLCDRLGLSQIEAAASMGISRGTVQRMLAAGRGKLVSAVLDRAALIIDKE